MNFTKKNKTYLIGGIFLGAILLILALVGEIILPFIFAIFIAHLLNPSILKIQKKIKNRYLAVTSFLSMMTLLFVGIVFFFGAHVVKDTKRLVNSVETFTEENEQQINNIKNSVLSFVDQAYDSTEIKNQLDSLTTEKNKKSLASSAGSIFSLFEDNENNKEDSTSESWSPVYMFIYTILYSITVLYSFDYFEKKQAKYFSDRKLLNENAEGVLKDFKTTFITFFKQRGKVVLLNTVILIIAFSIMDLPGAIIIGIVAGILSYASHYHYFSLPLVGIGCWMLSIENDTGFLVYFGILSFVYVLISILEETIYFDKIMKSVNGMNSAVMLLSFTLWISIFGGFIGTIIALPLTQLILIFIERNWLHKKQKREKG